MGSSLAHYAVRVNGSRAPVKICVVGSGPRFLSGISYYTHRLSSALAERYTVSVILMRQLIPTRLYPGRARVGTDLHAFRYPADVPVYDGVDWSWGRSALGAVRFLMARRPDVVVLQWWTGAVLHTFLLLALLAKASGARLIIEFHEVQDVGEMDVPLAGTYVNAVFPLLLRLSDGYVVHSEFDKTALRQRYRLGIQPVVLAPHGPYDDPGALSRRVQPSSGPFKLLYFGVIRPFKGVEDLLAAFDSLTDEQASSFQLTVVGETWEGHTLPARMVAASRHAQHILLVNRYVSDAEATEFFSGADAVVLPYHRSSASGPLHTAMSWGLPTVVTAVGGLVEAAGSYEGAVFVPPRDPDALARALLELPARRGERYSDSHTWDATVDRYSELFRNLGLEPLTTPQSVGAVPLSRNPENDSGVDPILVTEVELSGALPSLTGANGHSRALVLARLHEIPLGLLDVELPIGPHDLQRIIDEQLADDVLRHLRSDGLEQVGTEWPCAVERARFLTNEPPFLSVVIPSRERSERLSRCLDSIWRSDYPTHRFEVVVVDNDPDTESTRNVVDAHAAHHPCRYAREDARGSASARNTGIACAEGELLVFTDDDVRVDRHWLAEMAQALVRHPEAAAVSGLLLPMELETPAQVWFEQYGGFSRGFVGRLYDLRDNRDLDNRLYPFTAGVFGTGNNMAFRKSALITLGGFDPALGNGTPALGGVDSEMLLRTVLRGYVVVYEPRALVHHQHRRDYPGLQKQVYAYGVGLTAYMIKALMDNPRHIPAFLRRLPGGLAFALLPSSGKNAAKRSNYPAELSRLELRGMLYGPIGYARSRLKYGAHMTRREATLGLRR